MGRKCRFVRTPSFSSTTFLNCDHSLVVEMSYSGRVCLSEQSDARISRQLNRGYSKMTFCHRSVVGSIPTSPFLFQSIFWKARTAILYYLSKLFDATHFQFYKKMTVTGPHRKSLFNKSLFHHSQFFSALVGFEEVFSEVSGLFVPEFWSSARRRRPRSQLLQSEPNTPNRPKTRLGWPMRLELTIKSW